MTKSLVALLVCLLAATGSGVAQTPTNFAGRWVLASASPARPGFDAFWLGTEAVVTQTPTSITIERIAPAPERKGVFKIDGPGTENENVFTIDQVRHVKTSRVTLGQTLLISTETTLPDGKQWLSHINRWSMDANGDLVVTDTVICGSGECPSIVTTVRYKKQASGNLLAYSPARLLACFPIAYNALSVRMKICPSETAGELRTYSPKSFSARILNVGPAWTTLVSPSSFVM